MSKSPLVTVWIPTFNRKEMLERALLSVLAQDYPEIEIFIVDNGSTDGTTDLVADFMQRHDHIRYHRFDENRGACAARNHAIEFGAGELMTGLDDDDEFLPGRLSRLVAAYDEKYAFVCTGFYWDYGARRRAITGSHMEIDLHSQLNFNQASNQVLVSKQRMIEAGLFDGNMVSCQDWDMWTRLIIRYGTALRIAGPSYIVHTSHDKPRITGNISNRLTGLRQFYDKYNGLMSKENSKCFAFLQHYNSEKKLSLADVIKFFSWSQKEQIIRYYFASNFPWLAKKRLQRLRTK